MLLRQMRAFFCGLYKQNLANFTVLSLGQLRVAVRCLLAIEHRISPSF
jgi:hypothetical protein